MKADETVLERKRAKMKILANVYNNALENGSIRKFKSSVGTTKVNYNYGGIKETKQ